MEKINTEALANIHFHLRYRDHHAVHRQIFYARRVNFWRDLLPQKLTEPLMGRSDGESVTMDFSPGEAVSAYDERRRFELRPNQFSGFAPSGYSVHLREGRYYPGGLLRGVAGVFPQNVEPFRCTRIEDRRFVAEFNHPLSTRTLQVSAIVDRVIPKITERGGTSIDWMETVTAGPGMQSRVNGTRTDFFVENAFARGDERPDTEFYRTPRFVNHIDRRASETIRNLYGDLIPDGAEVLDLMSSWVSHLPNEPAPASVTGLGLNRAELDANERLSHRVVHDLNADPKLPFEAARFDAVICTVSIEYLTRPLAVFQEVARILKPGGIFVVTYSNRWFPNKTIRLWTELLEFERTGLIMEYFLDSARFGGLETIAVRGYPRPVDDKYFPEMRLSDPVYAVWGYRN
jgi:SAM-dependent methyltransferase/FKBP-type peptidyl-prolyl cis-trans isomerase 2